MNSLYRALRYHYYPIIRYWPRNFLFKLRSVPVIYRVSTDPDEDSFAGIQAPTRRLRKLISAENNVASIDVRTPESGQWVTMTITPEITFEDPHIVYSYIIPTGPSGEVAFDTPIINKR